MNYFRYKQFNKDVITVAFGLKNMPQFYIKFGRKSIKKLITNGVLIKIKGKWSYLYRAIDAEGHTLDIWLRKQRDNHSAYAFIKCLIKQFGKPQKVITDQAPSTKVAMAKVIKTFKLNPDCHCTSKYLNNLIEQDHHHIKVRKTIYQSINTAKNTLKGIEYIYGLYKKNRRSLQIYGFSPCHEISHMLAS